MALQSDAGSTELGLRFNVVSFVPTAFLLLFTLTLVGIGPPFRDPDLSNLSSAISELSATQVGVLSLFIVALGLIVHPLQLSLVRLLEGYWTDSRTGSALSAIGLELQRRRVELLDQELEGVPITSGRPWRPEDQRRASRERARRQRRQPVVAAVRLASYPPKDVELLPTRLGNALRAAESTAGQRYGLDTIMAWPRLYPHLSPRLAEAVADLRNQMDTAARFSVVLLLATLISTALLITHGWWLLVPAATAVLAWAAYRAAVNAATRFGEQLHVAFDLHRFDMLHGLHLPIPDNPQREVEANKDLSKFLARGTTAIQLGIDHYNHPSDTNQTETS